MWSSFKTFIISLFDTLTVTTESANEGAHALKAISTNGREAAELIRDRGRINRTAELLEVSSKLEEAAQAAEQAAKIRAKSNK